MNTSHVWLPQLQEVLKVVTISIVNTFDYGKLLLEQRWPKCPRVSLCMPFQFLPEVPPVSYGTPCLLRSPIGRSQGVLNIRRTWGKLNHTSLSYPLSWQILIEVLHGDASIHLINAIFWANVLLHIATVIQFNFEK
jgi:hypothetical protein